MQHKDNNMQKLATAHQGAMQSLEERIREMTKELQAAKGKAQESGAGNSQTENLLDKATEARGSDDALFKAWLCDNMLIPLLVLIGFVGGIICITLIPFLPGFLAGLALAGLLKA